MLLRLVFFGLCGIASAQASRTVLDGVYSGAQAARGQALFKEKCARCHEGADVDGPPLNGAPFLDRWREDTLAGLFDFLQTRMPQDAAGSLKPQEYADLLARLLQDWGFHVIRGSSSQGGKEALESMVHAAMLAHGKPKSVLIIGGADGGILREVLKYKSVKQAVLVDIDGELIDLCRQYVPSINGGAFEDPRTVNSPGDGAAYVAETNQKFDVILVDSTDPQGPGIVLFQAPFFRNCRRVMNPGGVMVTQNGVYFYQQDELRDAHKHRLKVFKKAGAYVGPIPTDRKSTRLNSSH